MRVPVLNRQVNTGELLAKATDRDTLVVAMCAARIAIGVTALAAPPLMAGPWIGSGAKRMDVRLMARAAGGRDLALGVGTLLARRDGDGRALRHWLRMGALSDATDSLLTIANYRRLPRFGRFGVLASAGGAAIVGTWLARE